MKKFESIKGISLFLLFTLVMMLPISLVKLPLTFLWAVLAALVIMNEGGLGLLTCGISTLILLVFEWHQGVFGGVFGQAMLIIPSFALGLGLKKLKNGWSAFFAAVGMMTFLWIGFYFCLLKLTHQTELWALVKDSPLWSQPLVPAMVTPQQVVAVIQATIPSLALMLSFYMVGILYFLGFRLNWTLLNLKKFPNLQGLATWQISRNVFLGYLVLGLFQTSVRLDSLFGVLGLNLFLLTGFFVMLSGASTLLWHAKKTDNLILKRLFVFLTVVFLLVDLQIFNPLKILAFVDMVFNYRKIKGGSQQ